MSLSSSDQKDTPIPGREAAVATLRNVMKEQGNQAGWDHAWQQNVTPWESELGNVPQPALVWAFNDEKTKELMPKNGKALVPGCGRGHDAVYLAERGFTSTGVDISPLAVKRANEWLESLPTQESHSRVNFLHADYFTLAEGKESKNALLEDVDLIYDYTFFCAIPPSLHGVWAESHAAALKQGGILLTLVFPLRPEGNDSLDGPPYFVTPELYKDLLSDQFHLEYLGVPPVEQAPKGKIGKEKVMVWRRK